MTKGRYILLCLVSQRKLKQVCRYLEVSYKYVYAVASGNDPSMKLARSLSPIIDMSYWNEDVDADFKSVYENKIKLIIDESENNETEK